MPSIVASNITKTFGNITAVDNVSFDVHPGEMFGLIGPDGSGKTSLFRILTTLSLADKGEAGVAGLDVVKDYKTIRKIIGYMPGRFSLYQDLTVKENLNFFATLFNTTLKENYHLIKDIYIQLEPFANRRAGKLSGGMKQKLALCCALVHQPKVLFLDEPTTGVDVVSRREFWDMLNRLKQQGISILVSTPYMDEANRCDRIALMQNGKLLGVNTPGGIVKSYEGKLFAARAQNSFELLHYLRRLPEVASAYAFGEWLHVSVTDGNPRQIEEDLKTNGFKNLEWQETTPGIEDKFIQLMQ